MKKLYTKKHTINYEHTSITYQKIAPFWYSLKKEKRPKNIRFFERKKINIKQTEGVREKIHTGKKLSSK